MTDKTATPIDRFNLSEASYQDAMEMGNSLARAIIAYPEDFKFDERVLCRAFCLSAKEEILATQRLDQCQADRARLIGALRELAWCVMDQRQAGQINDFRRYTVASDSAVALLRELEEGK